MENFRRFTIWGIDEEELAEAAQLVEAHMDGETGRNVIYYQVEGEEAALPYDCGFISDAALEDVALRYVVVEQGAAA